MEEALAEAGKTNQIIVFDGANHFFFNDTGERFNPETAEGACSDTLGWFDEYQEVASLRSKESHVFYSPLKIRLQPPRPADRLLP